MHIEAVNLTLRFAVLDDGTQVSITNLLDAGGDEVDHLDDAVSFVAGPDRNGDWHMGECAGFITRRAN